MRRRRKNPDASSVVTLGLLAAGGYLFYVYVWPMLKGIGNVASNAANTVAAPIANAYVNLTTPAVTPQGLVLMPDGSNFPAANLTNLNFGFRNGVAMFTMNGADYMLSPQVNGNYQATAT